MIKTKILAESDMQTLENAINAFIADKNVIDIKFQSVVLHVTYMDGVPIKNTINDRALIIYEEECCKGKMESSMNDYVILRKEDVEKFVPEIPVCTKEHYGQMIDGVKRRCRND